MDRFKRRIEEKEARERYMTETYSTMMAAWQKKVDRSENSKRRKEREAKSRELYEKIFPELRKQREDKERDHRLGTRGTVRSEAEVEDVIERIQEQEVSCNSYQTMYFVDLGMVIHLALTRLFLVIRSWSVDQIKV